MTSKVLLTFAALLTSCFLISAGERFGPQSSHEQSISPRSIFFQSGNINTVFRNDGIFNYDKTTFSGPTAGLLWPVSSASRLTTIFASGIWIGAKTIVSPGQKELRLASSFYGSHYSPGNIPVIGQVPPASVCNDSAFNGYLVSVTDPTLVNGGVRTKVAGGRTYSFNYSPWSAWPVALGAPYVEVNGIPGYQPGWNEDRPGTGNGTARPSEMIYVVFMDYTNCTNSIHASEFGLPGGTLPLGVEVQKLVYSFHEAGLLNSYYLSCKFINKSGKVWDSTYFGLVNDGDLGNPGDDAIGCDSVNNVAYTYNWDNSDSEYGLAPPAVGYSLVQGPLVFTGSNMDTAYLPCRTMIGYRIKGLSGHVIFVNGGGPCLGDPNNAAAAYNFLKGKDGCGNTQYNPITGNPTNFKYSGNACSQAGWLDSSANDVRNLISCGPITMNSGDTQVIVYAYNIERGSTNNHSLCSVLGSAENLKQQYYNCFNLIGVTPISSSVPVKFSLSQNYPNPFNPVTYIQFEVPVAGNVKLILFDALGREVTVLVNQNINAGSYKVDWNASDYPCGVYFYRLESGTFTATKKMVLVK